MTANTSVRQPEPTTAAAPPARVLVVEDEPAIAGFVRRGLTFEGFRVEVAADGRGALAALRDAPPDLVILDVMLPGVDGLEITRRVRAAEAQDGRPPVPILMLTARDGVPDRVAGLKTGADDYLVKPFAFDELLARVEALLRRSRQAAGDGGAIGTDVLRFADLAVDRGSRTAERNGREIPLTPREFDLLVLFLRHPNQVLPRSLLMSRVWGDDFFGDSNVLEVFVANLRRTLEAAGEPRLIQTVRGVGYVLRQVG